MPNLHAKNTVRYYLLVALLLVFLFFSNDFGLTDVQKTAIVMAVGIDREEDTFIVTSQIAIPKASSQGKTTEAVQLVSRGKTIGEAFEEINAKTGWYPKLVFCNLILLGEGATQQNVFDGLDFFLRDEYLSDNCFVATCDGLAKDLLNASALVDPSSSTAIQKILSNHAQRVGTVLPNTLKDFSIGYFSESQSSFLPIIKKEPQQEQVGDEKKNDAGNLESSNQAEGQNSGQANEKNGEQKQEDKPVFSAGETALFVRGKRVGTLNTKETFALSSVLNPLQLAAYSVEQEGETCSLIIKHNARKLNLTPGKEDFFTLSIHLTMTAGALDFSTAQSLKDLRDTGSVPSEFFTLASHKLAGEIQTVYEKCRRVECDLFGVRERLIKYERRRFHKFKDSAFENTHASVSVRFENIR